MATEGYLLEKCEGLVQKTLIRETTAKENLFANLSTQFFFVNLLVTIFCPTGGHHEGLSAPERGGDVQVRIGGRGALGYHGVPTGWSADQHRL